MLCTARKELKLKEKEKSCCESCTVTVTTKTYCREGVIPDILVHLESIIPGVFQGPCQALESVRVLLSAPWSHLAQAINKNHSFNHV